MAGANMRAREIMEIEVKHHNTQNYAMQGRTPYEVKSKVNKRDY